MTALFVGKKKIGGRELSPYYKKHIPTVPIPGPKNAPHSENSLALHLQSRVNAWRLGVKERPREIRTE